MPGFPPVVDGVTRTAAPAGGPPLGGLLGSLMRSMGGGAEGGMGMGDMMGGGGMDELLGSEGGDAGSGLMAVRSAIASLHKAARLDPRLADRIDDALKLLEGRDDSDDASGGSSNSLPPSMTAAAKTPV